MNEFRLEPADEYNHTPGAESNFNESVYVNGWDAAHGMGAWMRLGNRVNEGHAELAVCLYLPDGRVACQFQRPAITDNRSFGAGGLRYTVREPFVEVAMSYRGELMVLDDPAALRDPQAVFAAAPRARAEIDFSLRATSPAHGGEPLRPDQPTMYGRDFSLGHFYQHMQVGGHVHLGDQRWDLDGCGWRDHSWGPRYWTNIRHYRLFIANFGTDRGITLLKIADRHGEIRRVGVVQFDGEYETITDLDVITDWTADKDPRAIELGVRTASRALRLSGQVRALVPLRNRRKVGDATLMSRIAEGFTEWRWDDRQGLGITEYIEFLENGEPVGYPL